MENRAQDLNGLGDCQEINKEHSMDIQCGDSQLD